ncbi:MAG: cytochrome C biogenesis protein [Candidatus Magasanikbacteria bacterium CG10_big_fil_rev_8_21_14_0_10_47_10]|uniref:Cytochrome C biogenesis protein n=1 Tax=Candidatus Magasanikbacteria bacterium CG10_big_fil_rev_8_21_14_0_10_47_10 TaxID=1974652 RepID=A0A2H0TRA0_9BACT|nr:MAG: cytochrome C biogenesis protein [Candidatus Magasanikbacteria bacterium CG10_big_fil_rev_8_21_14_0_10_47_10]
MESSLALVLPAFFAGMLTFLAPCTFPLVPGYLGFIGGVSANDLKDPEKSGLARKKIFFNGLMYVIGFSAVFMLLGSIFGAAGSFLGQYRLILGRIGGLFVIFFGLYLMHAFQLPLFRFLNSQHRFNVANKLVPGKASSSFIFGATFAFGWTPCVGPVLGSVLILASTSSTAVQGALLLFMFSLGLAVPFLLLAGAMGHATKYMKKLNKYLNSISFVGGLFLLFLGFLLLTDNLGIWVGYFYEVFDFLNVDRLYQFL